MAYCSSCGAELAPGAAFCPKCGRPVSTTEVPPVIVPGSEPKPEIIQVAGLHENVAGMLCYLVGWITGLIFFLTDKRPFVRFHAMQSMITFGALHVLQIIFLGSFLGNGGVGLGSMYALGRLVGLLALVCWIVCMVMAYQGKRFKLPVTGNLAENYAK